jgi:hypothetical protein
VAPGGGFVDTYTVRIGGVATAAVATVTNAAVDGSWAGTPVAFTAGSNVSIAFTTTGATSASDCSVSLVFRPIE